MGSQRLPGKVLALLGGRPMLWHIIGRLRMSKRADSLILATTSLETDLALREFAAREGLTLFEGSEHDLLDRYYQAARAFQLAHIVRCTADNPLVDHLMLDRLIEVHLDSGADLTHSKTDRGSALPIGAGAEIYTFRALEAAWQEATSPQYREHVDEYIQEHPDRFRIIALPIPERLGCPGLRLTVDTYQDYQRMAKLYDALYVPDVPIDVERAIEWSIRQGWISHA